MHRHDNDNDTRVRVPATFSLKDVLTAIALVATVAVAWGLGSARLSFIERDQVALKQLVERHVMEDKTIALQHEKKLRELEKLFTHREIEEIQHINKLKQQIRELEFKLEKFEAKKK